MYNQSNFPSDLAFNADLEDRIMFSEYFTNNTLSQHKVVYDAVQIEDSASYMLKLENILAIASYDENEKLIKMTELPNDEPVPAHMRHYYENINNAL